MELSPVLLFTLLLCSFFWGIIIGIFNDINRIIRVFICTDNISPQMRRYYDIRLPIIKRSLKDAQRSIKFFRPALSILIFAQDILLVFLYILGLIFLNYSFNHGDFRFFTVLASFIGAIVYYFSVGKIIFNLSEFICFVIKAVIYLVLYVVFCPFVYILTKIQIFFEKIYLFFQNSIAKCIKKSYNNYKEKELMQSSLNAFIPIRVQIDKKA